MRRGVPDLGTGSDSRGTNGIRVSCAVTGALRGDTRIPLRSDRPEAAQPQAVRPTRTELNAIAAPAIIGLSSPAAASGSAATLYPNTR
jgi:hypothetical protein